jgi:hypothetical protein
MFGADSPVPTDVDVDGGTVVVIGFDRAVVILQRAQSDLDRIAADHMLRTPDQAERPWFVADFPIAVSAETSGDWHAVWCGCGHGFGNPSV